MNLYLDVENKINKNANAKKFINQLKGALKNNKAESKYVSNVILPETNMRKEGAIYKITDLQDDCDTDLTELTNIKTGEKFQETNFPHDIYHRVAVDSLVQFKNGRYSVVNGTSVYDLCPDIVENYCEREGVYVTENGNFTTAEDLYNFMKNEKQKENKKNIFSNIINHIKTFFEKN